MVDRGLAAQGRVRLLDVSVGNPSRVHRLKFGDLVADPEAEIASLCVFPGLKPVDGMDAIGVINSSYRPRQGTSGLDPSSAARWVDRLSPEETWWIETLTGSAALRAGYEPRSHRRHPGYACKEIGRTLYRVPRMVLSNYGRTGNMIRTVKSRISGMFCGKTTLG